MCEQVLKAWYKGKVIHKDKRSKGFLERTCATKDPRFSLEKGNSLNYPISLSRIQVFWTDWLVEKKEENHEKHTKGKNQKKKKMNEYKKKIKENSPLTSEKEAQETRECSANAKELGMGNVCRVWNEFTEGL